MIDKRLTHSQLVTLRTCQRKFDLRYNIGLRKSREATPLRFGHNMHAGLEDYGNYRDVEQAVALATAAYGIRPDWADPVEWETEQQTIEALLRGWCWFWDNDTAENVAVELKFELPLRNPNTGRASGKFRLAGKIDKIQKLADGRPVVLDHKTTGESIAPDAPFWSRLQRDPQISLYVLAAREIGYDVSAAMYDMIRKPTIKLKQNETPADYGKRLLDDIGERPEYYFARREVPRLESDLDEFRRELWMQAQQILFSRRANAWPRNVGRWTCDMCEFAGPCLDGQQIDAEHVPSGFTILSDVHHELDERE